MASAGMGISAVRVISEGIRKQHRNGIEKAAAAACGGVTIVKVAARIGGIQRRKRNIKSGEAASA